MAARVPAEAGSTRSIQRPLAFGSQLAIDSPIDSQLPSGSAARPSSSLAPNDLCLQGAGFGLAQLMGAGFDTAQLKGAGFKLNPYDPCVCNKTIGGKQMTVVWHVDDLKISHVDARAVNKMVAWLDARYPGVTATRGKKHEYFGIKFDFSTPGEVKLGMDDFIAGSIDAFPEEIFDTAPTPAGDHLF